LVNDPALARFFEETYALFPKAKVAANWLMSDVQGLLKERGKALPDTKLTPALFAELLTMVEAGAINGKTAKELLPKVLDAGSAPQQLVAAAGLTQITDPQAIRTVVREVLAANAAMVEEYRKGKEAVAKALIGRVMGATKGRANPQLVNELVLEELRSVGSMQ
jgi:aspartyl-tRNA(Asn)/glutamyl-tRNA(Gln) amidotransferase subunit B